MLVQATLANQSNIEYSYYERSSTLVLLLHAIGKNYTQLKPYLDSLKQKYSVLAPNLRCHGNSNPTYQDITELQGDLNLLLDRIPHSRLIIVTKSLSGIIGTALAHRAEKLIMITPTQLSFVRPTKKLLGKLGLLFFRIYSKKSSAKKDRAFDWSSYQYQGMLKYLKDIRKTMSLRSYVDLTTELVRQPLALASLQIPTKVILCKKDSVLNNNKIKKNIEENKQITLFEIDCEHTFTQSAKEESIRIIEEYIDA